MRRDWPTGFSIVSSDTQVWKPRVTVAAVCRRENRFLLVRERVDGREVFNQPAGHLEAGESIEQAVIREVREETAYDFIPRELVGIYRYTIDDAGQNTYLRFAISGDVGEQSDAPLDADILAAEWLTQEEIDATRDNHRTTMVWQCILDYLHKPAYPLQVFSTDFR